MWSLLSALNGAELQEVSSRWLAAMAHCKVQKEQRKIQDAKLKLAEKQALLEVKQNKAAERQKKKEESAQNLADKAVESLLKDPAGKPCFENLTVQAQTQVLKVMEGYTGGHCTRCRKGDGCLSCSKWKATRYWLQKEGFDVEHLYGASTRKASCREQQA